MERNNVTRNDYFWNMLGSICYSGSSFYYLLLVTRICGVEEAGVFSLAFATSQLLLTIGRFGVRTFQATDLQGEYSFEEYGAARIMSCVAMLAGAVLYVWRGGFEIWKASICIWVAAFKMIDAVEDLFHGEMQRRFYVDMMGKMLAIRNFGSCVIFTIVLMITRNLLWTCIYATFFSFALCLLINGISLHKIERNFGILCPMHVLILVRTCTPIFISTFLSLYLYNVPKYAIDFWLTVENQTYYSILFMPSFVITLFSEIITKPLMTTIAFNWGRNVKQFQKVVLSIMGLILLGTVAIVLGGHFIGRYLLEFVYGVDLSGFKREFIVLLIGGGVSASVYILYNLLIAIRHEKCIILVYGVTAIIMTKLGFLLVQKIGMSGAAFCYLISCVILFAFFAGILRVLTKRKLSTLSEGYK